MFDRQRISIRIVQAAFPELLPVTGCDFLAYSCAAARELHPLPCLRHKAKTRKPKDISKNGKYWCQEFNASAQWKSNAACPLEVLHSGIKVQFDGIDQRDEPRQERLMRRMPDIIVKRIFVFELHDAAERIAFSARRNIRPHMGLKKSRDYSLESGNLFRGSGFLSFGGPWLPLKGEDVKNARGRAFCSRRFRQIKRDEGCSPEGGTTIPQQGTAG